MGTIIKKKIKGINYYYYVESKRVDGKSKYVNPKYLGSADKLLKMANESGKTLQNQVLYAHEVTFGSVALLYDMAMRLDILNIIDEVAPKRGAGSLCGDVYPNCCNQPCSFAYIHKWLESVVRKNVPSLYDRLKACFVYSSEFLE